MKRCMRWGETQPRWEWEKTSNVVVFALDNVPSKLKLKVIKYVEELFIEFSLNLDVKDGNSNCIEDLEVVKEIIYQSMENNKIDYQEFEERLRKCRDTGKIPYGLAILIDKSKYEFCDQPGATSAIYGVGDDSGYVILRHTHKEAIRHEFAHMLGLGHHEPPNLDCIMNWECPTSKFCDECRRQIQKLWGEG